MAFTLPTFNLICNIDTVLPGDIHVFRLNSPCNLAMGRRVASEASTAGVLDQSGLVPILLLPPLTDIRDASCGGFNDLVECPAGSGRYYIATNVDDVGKGFPNEHRLATLGKIWGFAGNGAGLTLPWPTPIP